MVNMKNRTTDFSTLGYNERRLLLQVLRDKEGYLTAVINSAAADRTVITNLIEDIGEMEEDK